MFLRGEYIERPAFQNKSLIAAISCQLERLAYDEKMLIEALEKRILENDAVAVFVDELNLAIIVRRCKVLHMRLLKAAFTPDTLGP